MPIYHPINDTIVSREEFLQTVKESQDVAQFAVGATTASGTSRAFADIGLSKPMNIVLRRVYTGSYPQKNLLNDKKPMLLTSALKDATTTSAGARAVNMLKKQVSPKSSFAGPAALEDGTNLLYYSPGVVSSLITVTVELVFQEFDQSLFTLISKLFTSLGNVPIFMPASGYLMGLSTVVQLAGNVGQALVNGKPVLSESMLLDFSFGGGNIPVPGFWVFSANPLDLATYSFDPARGLVNNSTAKEYDGSEPYVVVSIDGTKQDGISSFTPLLASASILGQFYNQKPGTEVVTDSLVTAVTLGSDLSYRKRADRLRQTLSTIQKDTADYDSTINQYNALLANIQEPLLRPQSPIA